MLRKKLVIDCRSNSSILDIKALDPLLANNGNQDCKAVELKFNLKIRLNSASRLLCIGSEQKGVSFNLLTLDKLVEPRGVEPLTSTMPL